MTRLAATVVTLHCLLHGVDGRTMPEEYVNENSGSLWRSFKTQFGKVYKDDNEESMRRKAFVGNMLRYSKMSESNPHAEFGANIFADWTEEEYANMRKGIKISNNNTRNVTRLDSSVYKPPTTSANGCEQDSIDLDWVNAGVVTHVKSQGSCGSCWAFSATGVIESQWAIQGHALTSLSEQELVSCSGPPNAACGGGLPVDAFNWLLNTKNGKIVTEASFPYQEGHYNNGPVAPCAADINEKPVGAIINKILHIDSNEIQMYAALKHYGPVSIAVDATSWQGYTSGIMTNCISNKVDHGVLLVGHGYDSTRSLEYWVIKNSWGSAWGEAGYIRIQFGSNQCLVKTAPSMALVESLPPVPGVVPDPDSPTGLIPAVLTPEPLDPTVAVPKVPDYDLTCIGGSECDCPSFLFLKGKAAGGQVCTVAIVIPIFFVVFFMLMGALVATYASPRTGMTEEDLRRMLKEYKQRQQHNHATINSDQYAVAN
eukprot:TRINITY_DN2098_c0_g2_i1.p1 TRINITY_DN2098_c0_g2~~TRINITY_DN2098_c0_g2_i1.p1  ORF type:complete len:503 (+),score=54.22 TRINITY_DN2098_c0_g2_i1:60-1511(+)